VAPDDEMLGPEAAVRDLRAVEPLVALAVRHRLDVVRGVDELQRGAIDLAAALEQGELEIGADEAFDLAPSAAGDRRLVVGHEAQRPPEVVLRALVVARLLQLQRELPMAGAELLGERL